MSDEIISTNELMKLFDSSPTLVLYDSNLTTSKHEEKIEQILHSDEVRQLNPIDVVLESLLNVISEKFSSQTLTHSRKTFLINREMRNCAINKIMDMWQTNPEILQELHRNWLEKLDDFISVLKKEGVKRIEDVIFQISLKFRISAISTMKAISSLQTSGY